LDGTKVNEHDEINSTLSSKNVVKAFVKFGMNILNKINKELKKKFI
jgi:hypothetical protein